MAEPDDDRAAIDRAFAEMIAGYHLTADRPEVHAAERTVTEDPWSEPGGHPGPGEPSAETAVLPPRPLPPHPVPTVPVPPTPPVPLVWRPGPTEPVGGPADERYVPDPLPPLSRPGAPALVGWAAVLFAAVLVLAAGFGLDLPDWLGWLAVTAFIVGSVVLLTQLPRHRPPGSGDGAVL